ncbi:hypothetical protein [Ralstonia mojiangensis]|uniref:hypothetical protein n=1 Tax=Ralstonia mojiangensis TaxID=2953895 RepID=UPI0021B42B98|nr:hypothetical protein [Ralstonia mojiangensis]MCT7326258.1 hypothetical protein [Ralstonia mojiangensis]
MAKDKGLIISIVFVIVVGASLISSFRSGPSLGEIRDAREFMISDMKTLVSIKDVQEFDDDKKTKIGRASVRISIAPNVWSSQLSESYVRALNAKGWIEVSKANGVMNFCKKGASAFIAEPQRIEKESLSHGMVVMTFDGETQSRCSK